LYIFDVWGNIFDLHHLHLLSNLILPVGKEGIPVYFLNSGQLILKQYLHLTGVIRLGSYALLS